MKMTNQSQLWPLVLLFAGIVCLQIVAPKCSAAKTQGMGFFQGRPNIQATQQQKHNSSFPVETPELVKMVQKSINDSRRQLTYLSCGTENPIDDCWRCDPNWQMNRQRLADCATGFGRDAIGGKNGKYYVVTDSSDNDAVNPTPGTLRHAVIQDEPLWIIFESDMVIQLKEELLMNSFKTIDGRGADVHIAHGACITIQSCFLVTTTAMCKMLIMQVTIAFNRFGEGLVQSIPRCRHGHFHVVNNQFVHWDMYAIGGSANPTINSVGNRFIASDDADAKEVTKRIDAEDDKWFEWNWTSAGDLMLNGAYFIPSGAGAADNYALASSLGAKPAYLVETVTRDAGVLQGRTPSSKLNGNTYMSVSAAPMSILSASHSHQIIYFFMCTGCLVLTALNVLR